VSEVDSIGVCNSRVSRIALWDLAWKLLTHAGSMKNKSYSIVQLLVILILADSESLFLAISRLGFPARLQGSLKDFGFHLDVVLRILRRLITVVICNT